MKIADKYQTLFDTAPGLGGAQKPFIGEFCGRANDAFGTPYMFDGQGNPLTESAIGNPYLFTGRRYDQELGLYYYRARYTRRRLGGSYNRI